MSRHIRRWYRWSLLSKNNWFHKFLVLIKVIHSPTMYWMNLGR